MSETVKLIIEIPTDFYEITKAKVDRNMISSLSAISIAHGIPLNDVKAEIQAKEMVETDIEKQFYNMALGDVIEILENIGKADIGENK